MIDLEYRSSVKRDSFSGSFVIGLSFFIAIWLSFLPLPMWMNLLWPLWIILVLIFWTVYLPIKISPWMVFLLGILYDVLQNTWLGVHASAFILVYYCTLKMARPIKSFPLWAQMSRVMILLGIYQLSIFFLQGMMWSSLLVLFFPLLTSLILWPWVFFLLRSVAVKFYIHNL